MSASGLIEAVKAEGLAGGWYGRAGLGGCAGSRILEGGDDGGAASGGIFAETHVAGVLCGSDSDKWDVLTAHPDRGTC